MSEEELDAWYADVNRPYGKDELAAHLKWRTVKSALESTHAHNLELIELVREWIAFADGNGPRPENKLWRLLMPGTTMDNPACLRLETIVNFFCQYGHGKAPRMPIVVIVSQSTATLVELLDELCHTEQIDAARHHIRNFFALIAYGGSAKMPQKAFAEKLRGEMAHFIANCTENARKLGLYLIDMIRRDPRRVLRQPTAADVENAANKVAAAASRNSRKSDALLAIAAETAKTVRRIDNRGKRRNPRTKFSVEVQEQCFRYWEIGRRHNAVKENTSGKIKYDHVFAYYRRELTALGITSANDFKAALTSRSKRISKSMLHKSE